MKLERKIEQYRNGNPEVIVEGSKAQVLFALQDSRKDILTLSAEVERLLQLAYQYRDDMRHPPEPDSRERRIAAIDAAISKATA